MCLLIVNHEDTLLRSVFEHAWAGNPDGFGMAYVSRGKIAIYKNLTSWATAYTRYVTIRSQSPGAIILHFRTGTHGAANRANCHPFRVSKTLVFAHNGILDIQPDTPLQSDTAAFCATLKGLPGKFLENSSILSLLVLATGGSKIAFLDITGKTTILHAEDGHWNGKNWFSNFGYLAAPSSFSKPFSWRYRPIESCEMCGRKGNAKDMTCGEDGAMLCDSCADQIGFTWR